VGVGILLGVWWTFFYAAKTALESNASAAHAEKTHAEFTAWKAAQEAIWMGLLTPEKKTPSSEEGEREGRKPEMGTEMSAFKALATEMVVLRAQSVSLEKSLPAEVDAVQAHVDSIKGHAWAVYLLPIVTSVGAICVSGIALYVGKKA
jgi:hypothetical protein